MSSTAGNEWSNCQHCIKPVQTTETQFRQYHVTKVGRLVIYASPMIIKVGGLEPLGPIGVYAYARVVKRARVCVWRPVAAPDSELRPCAAQHWPDNCLSSGTQQAPQ